MLFNEKIAYLSYLSTSTSTRLINDDYLALGKVAVFACVASHTASLFWQHHAKLATFAGDHNTGNSVPNSLRLVFEQLFTNKGCATGLPAYSPYMRLEKTNHFADVITKATLSPQLFKDHYLNPGPSAH